MLGVRGTASESYRSNGAKGAGALLALSLCAMPMATPQAAEWTWFQQEAMTGDWGGFRNDLEQAGVTLSLEYYADFLANPVGGLEQSSAYSAGLYGTVELDFETLFGLTGTSLYIGGVWDSGRNLSGDAIGNLFAVSNNFNGRSLRLVQAYLEQELWDGVVEVAVGRLSTGDDFAASDLYGYYVSAAVNSNPLSLNENVSAFTVAPFAEWGARVTVEPDEQFYFSLGGYLANPDIEDLDASGVDLGFNLDQGVLAIGEVGLHDPLGGFAADLPGRVAFGGYFDSGSFERLDNGDRQEKGNYGFYLTAEQSLYREAANSDQGLVAWSAFTFAPDAAINTLPFAAYGGAVYLGLLPQRSDDATAVAFYYGSFSNHLEDQSYELVFEANHRFHLAPWLYLTPDMQYVVNPGGGGIPNALVVGMELGVEF